MLIKRLYLSLILVGTLIGADSARAADLLFEQIDWLDNASGYTSQFSDWGQVSIFIDSSDAPFFPGGLGYINIVTTTAPNFNPQWAVKNLPIQYDSASELDGRLPQIVWFDLDVTPGTPVTSIDVIATLDSSPRSTPPSSSPTTLPVSIAEELIGGENGSIGPDTFSGGTGQAPPSAAENFVGVDAGDGDVGRPGKSIANETDVPAVNEDKNGCAPAAVARSIKMLSNENDHLDVSDTAQQIYNDLRGKMGTTATGTSTPNILAGKNTYVTEENLPIASEFTNDFQRAIDTLNCGGDCEIGVYWGKNGAGQNMGAHRAFVSEITPIKDGDGTVIGYTVKYIDDMQGDGNAVNRTKTLKLKADGTLEQHGTGAKLINLLCEHVVAPVPALTEFGMVVAAILLIAIVGWLLGFARRRARQAA